MTERELLEAAVRLAEAPAAPANERNVRYSPDIEEAIGRLERFIGVIYRPETERASRQVELVMRALICQASGEDWRGVKLVLSTAAPMSWTELPELASIRIGRAQPPPPARAGFRPPPKGATALFAERFGAGQISVAGRGNVLASIAFLAGLEEVSRDGGKQHERQLVLDALGRLG